VHTLYILRVEFVVKRITWEGWMITKLITEFITGLVTNLITEAIWAQIW
jgi:hypothetical protein